MFRCYQWVLRNNQETCYSSYMITPKHYTSRKDVEASWCKDCCFTAIKPYRDSVLKGDYGEHIYFAQRRK